MIVILLKHIIVKLLTNNYRIADSDTVLTYQVSSVQLVTNMKLEAFNKAELFQMSSIK